MNTINVPDTLNWMMHPDTGVAMSEDAWRKGLKNTGDSGRYPEPRAGLDFADLLPLFGVVPVELVRAGEVVMFTPTEWLCAYSLNNSVLVMVDQDWRGYVTD